MKVHHASRRPSVIIQLRPFINSVDKAEFKRFIRGDLANATAESYSDTPFLNFYDEIITYKDVDETTDAFANYLVAVGLQKGDIVSFMMGNTPHFFYTLLGAQKIGAIGGPISCWWQAAEVEYLIDDSKPRILVVDPEYAQIVSALKDRMPSVERILVNAPGPWEAQAPTRPKSD